jgi:hypothetical protein
LESVEVIGNHLAVFLTVLTKATVFLAITFLVNTTLLALLGTKRDAASAVDSVTDSLPVAAPPSAPAPFTQPIPDMSAPITLPEIDIPEGTAIPIPTDTAVAEPPVDGAPPVEAPAPAVVLPVDVSAAPAPGAPTDATPAADVPAVE